MIPRTISTWQTKSWQEELSDLITSPEELLSNLSISDEYLENARNASQLFPLRATRAYVSRIQKGRIDDPLLKQILPIGEELITDERFRDAPLEEDRFSPAPGLIHKYYDRVLLVTTGQCAINCRYCFRRNFDYQSHKLSRNDWQKPLNYIASKPEIEEVILSGGDPLASSDKQLAWLVEAIGDIAHVQRIRIHTRLPIVAPSRITESLISLLKTSRLHPVVVIHCNHPQEIDTDVEAALAQLRRAEITMLNQAVLLKGINDNETCLGELSKKLFNCGVLPYYLHLLDKVSGAKHFDVSESVALQLINNLRAKTAGYLVPKLVKEVPDAPSKVAIA